MCDSLLHGTAECPEGSTAQRASGDRRREGGKAAGDSGPASKRRRFSQMRRVQRKRDVHLWRAVQVPPFLCRVQQRSTPGQAVPREAVTSCSTWTAEIGPSSDSNPPPLPSSLSICLSTHLVRTRLAIGLQYIGLRYKMYAPVRILSCIDFCYIE